MNLTVAPLKAPSRPRTRPVDVPAETSVPVASRRAVADPSADIRRWVFGLGIPFTFGAVFFGAAIGTGNQNLLAPAIVLGPILMMFAFILLCIGSDTNGRVS